MLRRRRPEGSETGEGGGTKHDATTTKKDSGATSHDSGHPKDTGHDVGTIADATGGGAGDAAPNTPCTADDQCSSKVCKSVVDAGKPKDGGLGCAGPGSHCECQPPTCTDGVQNEGETDIDCGGGHCAPCKDGDTCLVGHQDCVSGECGIGTQGGACNAADAGPSGCTCQAPTCDDGVKNGTESDTDCGNSGTCPVGESCPKCTGCTTGKKCAQPPDCISVTCTASVCACPPGMTEASTSLNIPYCIDAYEATYTQYTAFKNAHNISEQPAYCAWNLTYSPTANFPQLPEWSNNPVTNVNWCDAYMYCHTSGKHLCGQIANPAAGVNEGDPIDPSNANVATKDEWYNACSDQGQNTFPYGVTYHPDFCNGADSAAQRFKEYLICNSITPTFPSPVPTVCAGETLDGYTDAGACLSPPDFYEADCIGGTSNVLYDMSGNVAEWEDSCTSNSADAGETDTCNVRGGSFLTPQAGLTCATSAAQPPLSRDATRNDVGIRCCL